MKAVSEANQEADGYTSQELAEAMKYSITHFRNHVLARLIEEGKIRFIGKRRVVGKNGTSNTVKVYELLKPKKKAAGR